MSLFSPICGSLPLLVLKGAKLGASQCVQVGPEVQSGMVLMQLPCDDDGVVLALLVIDLLPPEAREALAWRPPAHMGGRRRPGGGRGASAPHTLQCIHHHLTHLTHYSSTSSSSSSTSASSYFSSSSFSLSSPFTPLYLFQYE